MSGSSLIRVVAAAAFIIVVGIPVPTPAQARTVCPNDGGKGKNSSSTTVHDNDDGDRTWRVSWSNGSCSLDMRSRGKIQLKRDLSDVESISRGGYFELSHREDGTVRRYEVTNKNGTLERFYSVDRREQPIDAAGQRWLAAALLELERTTGFAAEWRVSDLLRSGGVDAVLREVAGLRSGHVQRKYLTVMLDSAKLTEGQVRATLKLAGDEITSDYEQASLLRELGKRGYVTARTAGDFVAATAKVKSDYEKRRALSAVLALENLPAPVVVELLKAAGAMRSDYERAQLLLSTAKANGLPTGEARDAYLTAAVEIGSDYEKRRVLSTLVADRRLSDEQLVSLLGAAVAIRSDYELATLLVSVAKQHAVDGRVRDAYLKAAETIGSDHEQRRALSALVRSSGTARM